MKPVQASPQRVVATFKANKWWAYKQGNVGLAYLHTARVFGISVRSVKQMVYEAKPKKPDEPEET